MLEFRFRRFAEVVVIRRDFIKSSLAMATVGVNERISAPPQNPETASFPKSPGLTKYVSQFIVNTSYADIPTDVLESGRKSILDGFGLALAGSASAIAPLVRQYLQGLGVNGKAAVIGSGMKVPPRFAAFANGTSIHADDFDDTQLPATKDRVHDLLTHPTATTLTPAFAICELGERSGKDFMLAFHVGVEVESKIAGAIDPRHYNDGFHSTGTCGSFGSAAAYAKLRGLDPQKTAYALGIAASQCGGLRDNFGSMTKSFQAGHAAENGMVAVDLAAFGWTAAPDILEGALGFFQAAGGGFDPSSIVNRLGSPWTFASPGVSIKPFPSSSLTHPAMGEWLGLIRKYNIKPGEVEEIEIGTSHDLTTALYHHRPMTGLQAKLSMEFSLSILLLERKGGLNEYTDIVVRRRDVQQMMKRVKFYVDPGAEAAGFDSMTSLLTVHLKDGRVIQRRVDLARGSPANPMSFEEVADKFRSCADFAKWPRDKAEGVISFVKTLDTAPDMSELTMLLIA